MDDVFRTIWWHVRQLRKFARKRASPGFDALAHIQLIKALLKLRQTAFEDQFYKINITDPLNQGGPSDDDPYHEGERPKAFADLAFLHASARSSLVSLRAFIDTGRVFSEVSDFELSFENYLNSFSDDLKEIKDVECSLLGIENDYYMQNYNRMHPFD